MFTLNQLVEINNHSEPSCSGQLGTIVAIDMGYDGHTRWYTVQLEESRAYCVCIEEEIMEG